MNFFKLLIPLCTLIIIFTVNFIQSDELLTVEAILREIGDKYKCTGITFAWPERPGLYNISGAGAWDKVILIPSNDKSIIHMQYNELGTHLKYMEKTQRPLIVIIIDEPINLHSFQSMTTNTDMIYGQWLIMFDRIKDIDVCDFCRNPPGNLFNLKFHSKVLITCCESDRIDEWWCVKENRTKRQTVARWVKGDSKFEWIPRASLYSNRYSLDGRVLQVAAVNSSTAWKTNGTRLGGFTGELLVELSHAMNFTISKIEWENSYGDHKGETSNWTGILGRVIRGDVDLGASEFVMPVLQSHSLITPFPHECVTQLVDLQILRSDWPEPE